MNNRNSKFKEQYVSQTSIPTPPFLGRKVVSLPLEDLFELINIDNLYRVTWGAKNAKGEKWKKYELEFNKRLEKMRIEANPWLQPKAVYGYWECNADENSLVIYLNNKKEEVPGKNIRFKLPRQQSDRYLCLSDFFLPVSEGIRDLVAFQLVTIGHQAVEYVQRLNDEGNLVESFYSHGLAAHLTEAAAKFTHKQIRRELNIGEKQGKRYSWGYPPIPDLSQHAEIVQLLDAREQLEIELTSAFQFIPEYSTAALVIHNANAVYFQTEQKGPA